MIRRMLAVLALTCVVSPARAGEVATERGQVVRAAQLQLRARELYRVVVRGELSPQTLELLTNHPLGQH